MTGLWKKESLFFLLYCLLLPSFSHPLGPAWAGTQQMHVEGKVNSLVRTQKVVPGPVTLLIPLCPLPSPGAHTLHSTSAFLHSLLC